MCDIETEGDIKNSWTKRQNYWQDVSGGVFLWETGFSVDFDPFRIFDTHKNLQKTLMKEKKRKKIIDLF